jgi:hypothetical protein
MGAALVENGDNHSLCDRTRGVAGIPVSTTASAIGIASSEAVDEEGSFLISTAMATVSVA